jgi:hypothetical protein
MDRKGLRELVRDGLGCAVVLAVLGIGGAGLIAGVAVHAHGARKNGDAKKDVGMASRNSGNATVLMSFRGIDTVEECSWRLSSGGPLESLP